MADAELKKLHATLIGHVRKQEWSRASSCLTTCKIALLHRNALVPSEGVAGAILLVAREMLEIGAVVAIHEEDGEAFSVYFAQLQPFYEVTGLAPASKNRNKIVGLYLLLLLSRNSIAEFHTTLENLDCMGNAGESEDLFISYPIKLERWLMEGSYDKVWKATQSDQPPSEEFALFSQVLIGTIRNEIASSSEKAYASLPVSNAKQLLFLESDKAVVEFASRRTWSVRDGRIYFPNHEDDEKEPVASRDIIATAIQYAQQLETIV